MKALLASLAFFIITAATRAADAVQITQLNDRIRVEISGRLFTEYHFTNVIRPFFYPIIGPGDSPMTREWPNGAGNGEEHDHSHHSGLWYSHSSVDHIDFWNNKDKPVDGKFVSVDGASIVHRQFSEIQSGPDSGIIKSTDDWLAKNGDVVCSDERTMTFYASSNADRIFDFDITLHAPPGKPVVFGDDKDGAMAIRVAESMRLKFPDKKPGPGHIVLSTGLRDENTWGKRADWCDYFGPVKNKIVGVAIFDHPSNPRHPTWWHVRDYGLFAANPWGVHYFENQPKGAGDMKLNAGESITFRYRFYFHEGDASQAKVAEHYQTYTAQ